MRDIFKNIYWRHIDMNYSEEEQKIMEYIFVTCCFEFIKILLIMSALAITNYFKEGLIICIVMFTSKPFIGGYHEENQIRCFISTVMAICFILVMGKNSDFTYIGNMLLVILSIFCIWNQAPVLNSKMPITRADLINKNRIIGTSIIILFGIISIIMHKVDGNYIFITYTIVFQALMMFEKNLSIKSTNLK